MKQFMVLLMLSVVLVLAAAVQAEKPVVKATKAAKDTVQNLVFTGIEVIGALDNPQGIYILAGEGDAGIVLKLERPPRAEEENIDREAFEEMTAWLPSTIKD